MRTFLPLFYDNFYNKLLNDNFNCNYKISNFINFCLNKDNI